MWIKVEIGAKMKALGQMATTIFTTNKMNNCDNNIMKLIMTKISIYLINRS